MKKPECTISSRVAGPCYVCGKRAPSLHMRDEGDRMGLYCADCCPVHGVPAVTVESGSDTDPAANVDTSCADWAQGQSASKAS